jgi:peroxiredoxin
MFRSRILAQIAVVAGIASGLPRAPLLFAQTQPAWSEREKPLAERLSGLRRLPDAERARATRELAIAIRQLPATGNRFHLASQLTMLSTEGDPGRETLQAVADTMADVLRRQAVPGSSGAPTPEFTMLAQLVRYEGVNVSLDSPQFAAAMSRLEAAERQRQRADFTLRDLKGAAWTLKDLKGRVVLVNFWATWCPPCRKEMPDLQALYDRFASDGLVVLAISDEDAAKVQPFVDDQKLTFPVLLDPGGEIARRFQVEGIPKSFVYDRAGKLVAQAIDMRTRKQFLDMLRKAGLTAGEARR